MYFADPQEGRRRRDRCGMPSCNKADRLPDLPGTVSAELDFLGSRSTTPGGVAQWPGS
jgi:hypothetical protein